jgi:hypothetical protein
VEGCEHEAGLVHRQERHAMGRCIWKMKVGLGAAHGICKRPAARHDDDGHARLCDNLEDAPKPLSFSQASAQLQHDRPP